MFRWIALAAGLAMVVVLPASAESLQYEEGTHYAELRYPVRTANPNKIEVTEYFSYGCPHCYQFEPMIRSWSERLGDDVVFSRTPATWNEVYQVFARAYYTAQQLGVQDLVHLPLFNAIHQEHRPLQDPTQMALFFSEYGVDPLDFAKVFKSFGVESAYQQADARGRAYRSRGVPAIIVNGKYRIEGEMAGSNANMLRIADFLIEKERQALKTAQAE